MNTSFDLNTHLQQRKLIDAVENRTTYASAFAELHIYETHLAASKVQLRFADPVLASMISGKKVMHLANTNAFEFLPNESIILPGNEEMYIDFPEANEQAPTQCLALALSAEKIREIIAEMNDKNPMIDTSPSWQLDNENFYFNNDPVVHYLLNHLIQIFTENNKAKDIFAEYTLKELIIRLMQTKARHFLLENLQTQASSNRLAHAIKYIEDHIFQNITIAQLAGEACMSEANFYKCFKNQLGISPIDYINHKRIEAAKRLMSNIEMNISEISALSGFNSLNHFFNQFKKYVGTTPASFRKKLFNPADL